VQFQVIIGIRRPRISLDQVITKQMSCSIIISFERSASLNLSIALPAISQHFPLDYVTDVPQLCFGQFCGQSVASFPSSSRSAYALSRLCTFLLLSVGSP